MMIKSRPKQIHEYFLNGTAMPGFTCLRKKTFESLRERKKYMLMAKCKDLQKQFFQIQLWEKKESKCAKFSKHRLILDEQETLEIAYEKGTDRQADWDGKPAQKLV